MERFLIPTGLHHLIYTPFQFSALVQRFAEFSGAALPDEVVARLTAVADDPKAVRQVGVEVATEPVGGARRGRARSALLHAEPVAGHARDPAARQECARLTLWTTRPTTGGGQHLARVHAEQVMNPEAVIGHGSSASGFQEVR